MDNVFLFYHNFAGGVNFFATFSDFFQSESGFVAIYATVFAESHRKARFLSHRYRVPPPTRIRKTRAKIPELLKKERGENGAKTFVRINFP